MITLRKIVKHYREGDHRHNVLEDLDLRVESGEIVVVLGKSGSGKSTLLNIISGIDTATSGDVRIGETRLTSLTERERTLFRRKHIGFVFQFFNLVPTLTVTENLLLPMELNASTISSGFREQVSHYLNEVGLGDRGNSYPDRLSGGEQQRVAIARSIIHDPDLVLADEPTGNLDYETGKQVMELLDRMVRDHGKTLVMATHSPEVIGLADRIYRLKGGKLVPESGPEQ